MIEALVREQCPAAVPLAETMVDVLRGIPGPRPANTQIWYEEACWARAALEHGMDLPDTDEGEVVAARHAGRIIPDEPAGMWGRRVSFDAAPVRMIYLLEIAARLKTGDHPVQLPRTASRKLRSKYVDWRDRVRWCEAMLYGLGTCEAYLESKVMGR